ncbi:MAG: MMPL family transporter [Clostridia bacterium]|nr:MMPL family transporter [Clostridia bacterium]
MTGWSLGARQRLKGRELMLGGLWSRIALRHPRLVIAITLALSVLFAYGAAKVRIDSGQRGYFPENDPGLARLDQVEDAFGGSNTIMAAALTAQVFTPEGLRALDRLTQELREAPGVVSVQSVTNIAEVTGEPWGIDVRRILEELPESQDEAASFHRRLQRDLQAARLLLSDDGSLVMTLVHLSAGVDSSRVAAGVRALLSSAAPVLTIYATGGPVLISAADDYLRKDLQRLFPIVAVVIVGLLVGSFRRWQGALLPMITVGLSTLYTVGLMGFMGTPLSQITVALTVILLSVGSAYGIHMMHRLYEEQSQGRYGRHAMEVAFDAVTLPIILAGATTIAGFGANAFSSIVRIREFGLLAAFGVACALLLALMFIPAAVAVFGGMRPSHGEGITACVPQAQDHCTRDGLFQRLAGCVTQRPATIWLITAIVAVWSVAGLPRIKVDTNFVSFFPSSSQARRDFDLVRSKFGGASTIHVMIEGDVIGPEVLEAMEAAQREFEAAPGFGKSVSVVDLVKQVSRAMHGDDPSFARIPESRGEVAQYLLIASMSGDIGIERLLTMDNQKARIEVVADAVDSSSRATVVRRATEIVERHFGPASGLGVSNAFAAGMLFLDDGMSNLITRSQTQSLFLAVISVFVIVYLALGRSLDSALCIVPILLTILVNFAVMGWAGIPFDVVTAVVSSVAVGIGIDYSIHIYSRFREASLRGKSPSDALRETIATTGRAVVLNAGAVAAGFVVLMLSSFPPLRNFGGLIALTMATSSIGALTLLPALLLAARRRDA